jgi:hypothetical protein
VRSVAAASAVFLLWSLSRLAEGQPHEVGESIVKVTAVLATRLAERLAHARRDRREVEETSLRERVDDARRLKRQAEEMLDDEQRQMLRELRRIKPDAEIGDVGKVQHQQKPEHDQQPEQSSDDESSGEVDARDMYSGGALVREAESFF